jgi:predicted NBD/HSP70 family sugar kinase/predicted transcriptional regulator
MPVERVASDTDSIRRQNRRLVLDVLRHLGPLARTTLATETGLSHATITAIAADLTNQGILVDLDTPQNGQKTRGRPAVRLGHKRNVAFSLLFEIDVNRARCSLIDYGGTIVDRIETELGPDSFKTVRSAAFLAAMAARMRSRNPEESTRIANASASVQGILNRAGTGLTWSPIAGFAGQNLSDAILAETGVTLALYKRGRLLAEGTRLLFPELQDVNVATVFVGATIAMGMSFHGNSFVRSEDTATEFGHMVHIPNGALCRCGTRGCIEAYAADYGILRTAYGVPDTTPPAPAVPHHQYVELMESARRGDRNAAHAFNLAGSAIGFGINRLMTVFDPSHIVIVGPGAEALPLMRGEIEKAISASLVGRLHGVPQILTHSDESEPIFRGLKTRALTEIDQNLFAPMPSQVQRTETL